MPSDCNGTPVEAANSLACSSMTLMSDCGLFDGSCAMVGVWPCLSMVAIRNGFMYMFHCGLSFKALYITSVNPSTARIGIA